MHRKSAIKLFIDQAGKEDFLIKDILNTILKDKNYPIQKIMPSVSFIPNPVTE